MTPPPAPFALALQIAELRLDLRLDDGAVLAELAERFARFLDAPPRAAADGATAVLLSALPWQLEPMDGTTVEAVGGATRVRRRDFDCTLERRDANWHATARIEPGSAGAADACARLLAAAALLDRGRALVHASAATFAAPPGAPAPDVAAVFMGQSGAGKSTLARLAAEAGHPLLGDDLVVIGVAGVVGVAAAGGAAGVVGVAGRPRAFVWGTPFSGETHPPGTPGGQPAAALFRISHGGHDRAEPVPPFDATRLLLARTVLFRADPAAGLAALNVAEAVAAAVPLFTLSFRPTPDVVSLVQGLVGSLERV